MTVQQHDRRPTAAMAHAQHRLTDIDAIAREVLEEHPHSIPEFGSGTHVRLGDLIERSPARP